MRFFSACDGKGIPEPKLPPPIITLTTDYGLNDYLVGAMRGAILNVNPDARIADITHNVMSFDVLDGALAIAQAYRFYPPRTIHVVVVDPGVGTERRAILVSGDQHYFVGPDNGVFSLIYERDPLTRVREITAEHYFLQPVSSTFHGRDVFAPVAAWLSRSTQPESFGEEVNDYVRFSLPKPKAANNTIKGVILRVDNFGNLLTNLSPQEFPQLAAADARFKMQVGKTEITKMAQSFSQGATSEPQAIIGSSGFVEIFVNRGSAARTLGVQRGSEVTLRLG